MNTLDAILTRRSCREFTDKPIKSETLHQLLEAAMSGPSCVNARDWSFVVVTDPEKLAQMADANGRPAEPLRKAAAGILVCGDLDRAFRFAKVLLHKKSAGHSAHIARCKLCGKSPLKPWSGLCYNGKERKRAGKSVLHSLFHLDERGAIW